MAVVAGAPRLRNDAHKGEAAFVHKSLNTSRGEGNEEVRKTTTGRLLRCAPGDPRPTLPRSPSSSKM
ncbi:hypothetical protein MRX96_047334 [Rhipicephalus microplus]